MYSSAMELRRELCWRLWLCLFFTLNWSKLRVIDTCLSVWYICKSLGDRKRDWWIRVWNASFEEGSKLFFFQLIFQRFFIFFFYVCFKRKLALEESLLPYFYGFPFWLRCEMGFLLDIRITKRQKDTKNVYCIFVHTLCDILCYF